MSAHAGADTGAGVFASHGVGRATFEPLHQFGDCKCGRVGHEQVDVVGFAVELDQLDIEFGAYRAHGVLAKGERLIGEQRAAKLGYKPQMRVQQRHAVSGAAIGRGCQGWALRCGCADG